MTQKAVVRFRVRLKVPRQEEWQPWEVRRKESGLMTKIKPSPLRVTMLCSPSAPASAKSMLSASFCCTTVKSSPIEYTERSRPSSLALRTPRGNSWYSRLLHAPTAAKRVRSWVYSSAGSGQAKSDFSLTTAGEGV